MPAVEHANGGAPPEPLLEELVSLPVLVAVVVVDEPFAVEDGPPVAELGLGCDDAELASPPVPVSGASAHANIEIAAIEPSHFFMIASSK